MIEVILTKEEVLDAASVGCRRQTNSLFRGDRESRPSDNPWQIHIFGALGECAAAKGLKIEWPKGVNTYSKPDLPPNIQVKTRSANHLDLPIPFKAKDSEVYVLVTGEGYKFQLLGYIGVEEAKQEAAKEQNKKWEFWPHKCWYVPQSNLKPIEGMVSK